MKYKRYIKENFFDDIQSDNIEIPQKDITKNNDSYNDLLFLNNDLLILNIALLGEVTQFNKEKKSLLKKLVEQTFKIAKSCLDDIAVVINNEYEFVVHPDSSRGTMKNIDLDSFVFNKDYENKKYSIVIYFQKNDYVSPMSAHRFTNKLMSLKKMTVEDGDVCYNVSNIKYYTSDLLKTEYYNVPEPDFFSIRKYKKQQFTNDNEMNEVSNQIIAYHNFRLLNIG